MLASLGPRRESTAQALGIFEKEGSLMSLFHKKKALVLFGSPHSHGHTAWLLESFLECFRHHGGWEVEVADLYRLNPHPCTGCKACAKEERCA